MMSRTIFIRSGQRSMAYEAGGDIRPLAHWPGVGGANASDPKQSAGATLSELGVRSEPPRLGLGRSRLKVLQVVEATFAGVGRHVADLCAALLVRGHEVHLAYSPVRIEERFAHAIAALADLRTVPLQLSRGPSPSDIGAILTLRRYIRARGPFDVVHGHSSKGGAVARLAAAGLGSPRVYTAHALRTLDPDLSRGERILYEAVERVLGKGLTEAFVGVAREEACEARRLGVAAERTHVVPNGIVLPVVPDRATVRARYGLDDGHVCLMWVGRLSPQKAPDRFVRLLASLAEQIPEVRAVMIGSGPLEAGLRELVRDLGLAARLQLVQDQQAVLSMRAADIYVMTSRYEGLPYVLLEAQSLGLPVVAFDVGGLSTAVHSGATGFVLAQDDEIGFDAALRRLIGDAGLRRDMGAAAGRRAERFRLQDMVDRIEALYFRLSADGCSGALAAT
jgi:glycosyltransferase involved in cell wall biosynthesis